MINFSILNSHNQANNIKLVKIQNAKRIREEKETLKLIKEKEDKLKEDTKKKKLLELLRAEQAFLEEFNKKKSKKLQTLDQVPKHKFIIKKTPKTEAELVSTGYSKELFSSKSNLKELIKYPFEESGKKEYEPDAIFIDPPKDLDYNQKVEISVKSAIKPESPSIINDITLNSRKSFDESIMDFGTDQSKEIKTYAIDSPKQVRSGLYKEKSSIFSNKSQGVSKELPVILKSTQSGIMSVHVLGRYTKNYPIKVRSENNTPIKNIDNCSEFSMNLPSYHIFRDLDTQKNPVHPINTKNQAMKHYQINIVQKKFLPKISINKKLEIEAVRLKHISQNSKKINKIPLFNNKNY